MKQMSYLVQVLGDYRTLTDLMKTLDLNKAGIPNFRVEVYDWGEMEIWAEVEVDNSVDLEDVVQGDAHPWGVNYYNVRHTYDYSERSMQDYFERAIAEGLYDADYSDSAVRTKFKGWQFYA